MEALCKGYEHFKTTHETDTEVEVPTGCYQHPSDLQLVPLASQCSRGVQQGYPLGPLVFSLVLLADLLDLLTTQGPSFGLTLNL